MAKSNHKITGQPTAKDGLDHTGTQGYDSLSDDAYIGAIKAIDLNENDPDRQTPLAIESQEINGEKIIFDLIINKKLAHAIVIKNGRNFHFNLDGEDVGRLETTADGTVKRFPQPKGASSDHDTYFNPLVERLKELNLLS